jgi:hypothetical protein
MRRMLTGTATATQRAMLGLPAACSLDQRMIRRANSVC